MNFDIPVGTSLGILELSAVRIGLTPVTSGFALAAGANLKIRIATVTLTANGLGLELRLGAPDGKTGNLGSRHLAFGGRLPNEVAISIEGPPIDGGGCVYLDPDRGEYKGVLELSLFGIQIKAFGLLNTRFPDGTPGFSLFIIISAQFDPVQIGFGFTLNGVGGMLGIQRTVNVEALRAAAREGNLDHLLFPQSPAENATEILATLSQLFPPARKQVIFGPMVELGWGTPTLLTIRLGLMLELPSPARLGLLGQLKVRLPSEEAALVTVNLDLLGLLDFSAKRFTIDASLHDSQLCGFQMTGQAALEASWGDRPTFIASIGGFHPSFSPPAGFPSLQRAALSLSSGSELSLGCEAYLAVTSSSFQFGAHAWLRIDFGFRISGDLSFDALFQFSPRFFFDVGIGASVAIGFGDWDLLAIRLAFALSGPAPWRARGSASIEILFFEISVDFDFTWGDSQDALETPKTDVAALLSAALQDLRNWRAPLPEGRVMGVTLRGRASSEEMRVHPLGGLEVRQRVVPLGIPIERFGNTEPNADLYDVTGVLAADEAVISSLIDIEDPFVREQFFDLSDQQKLTEPAFDTLKSGVSFSLQKVENGRVMSQAEDGYEDFTLAYEISSPPPPLPHANADPVPPRSRARVVLKKEAPQGDLSPEARASRAAAIRGCGAATVRRNHSGKLRYAAHPQDRRAYRVQAPAFAVVDRERMASSSTEDRGLSFAAARGRLREKDAAAANYQIVGLHEII